MTHPPLQVPMHPVVVQLLVSPFAPLLSNEG